MIIIHLIVDTWRCRLSGRSRSLDAYDKMAGVVGVYTSSFAVLGILSVSYIALRALYTFWRVIKSYLLSPVFGLGADVKSLGEWAGMGQNDA